MDISSLRSLLQHVCRDLKNLTNNDLVDCKWIIKRNIFHQLFKSISSLSNECIELDDLIDQRNQELAFYKANIHSNSNINSTANNSSSISTTRHSQYRTTAFPTASTVRTSALTTPPSASPIEVTVTTALAVSKEHRIEMESIFRSKFMKIILAGLAKLSWPPTLIPFSDPMNDLFNDNAVILNAIEYMVKIAANCNDIDYQTTIMDNKRSSSGAKGTMNNKATRKDSSEAISVDHDDGKENTTMLSPNAVRGTSTTDVAMDVGVVDLSSRLEGISYHDHSLNHQGKLIDSDENHKNDSSNWDNNTTSTNNNYRNTNVRSNINSGNSSSGSNAIKEKRNELNWHAFEILQKQNEILSSRLYHLQCSIKKRDVVEGQLTGILNELKASIAEIVSIGQVKEGDNGPMLNPSTSSSSSSFIRQSSSASASTPTVADSSVSGNINFINEVMREENDRKQLKSKVLGNTSSIIYNDVSVSSITATSDKYTAPINANANRNDRDHHRTPVNQHNKPSNSIGAESLQNNQRRSGSTKRNSTTATATPSKVIVTKDDTSTTSSRAVEILSHNKKLSIPPTSSSSLPLASLPPPSSLPPSSSPISSIIWSKLYSKIASLTEQWATHQKQSRFLAETKGIDSYALHRNCKDDNDDKTTAFNTSRSNYGSSRSTYQVWKPSSSLVNNTLGLQRPLLSSSQHQEYHHNDSGGDEDNSYTSMCAKNGLDLSRIHLLQRDLIQFSEKCFQWTNNLVIMESYSAKDKDNPIPSRYSAAVDGSDRPKLDDTNDNHHHHQYLPQLVMNNDSLSKHQQLSYDLQHTASKLLIHLSCLAPIAPLSADTPHQSHLSGLNLLLHEISESVFPKLNKQYQHKLQQCCDRALSEQISLIRSYHQSTNALQQWVKQATSITPSLQVFGRKFKSLIGKTVDEIRGYHQAMNQIVIAIDEADNSRVMKGAINESLPAAVASSAVPNTPILINQVTSSSIVSQSSPSLLLPPTKPPPSSSSSLLSSGASPPLSNVLVNPLDLLSRGILGLEVSTLIQTLRIHKESIDSISNHLYLLSDKISLEVKREVDFVCKLSDRFLVAADMTTDLLIVNNDGGVSNISERVDSFGNSSRSRRRNNKG